VTGAGETGCGEGLPGGMALCWVGGETWFRAGVDVTLAGVGARLAAVSAATGRG
jgi:hypothetical protein